MTLPSFAPDPPPRAQRIWPLVLALLVLPAAAYRHSLAAPFVFDDFRYITQNPNIHSLWPLTTVVDRDNRPVVALTLAVNYAISQRNPWSYHALNLAIHLVAALALFGLVRRSCRCGGVPQRLQEGATLAAFATALLWALHPLQTQSVTYVIQRGESLMGMFFLLFLYFLARAGQAHIAWPWGAAAVACCWLGMGCKEVMATAPLVGLLYDRAFLASSWRETLRRRGAVHVLAFAGAAALAGYYIFLTRGAEGASMGFGIKHVTPWEYLRTQPEVILHYLRLAFWPDVLCIDYAWPVADSPWRIYGLGAVILALLAASAAAWWKWPKIGFLGLSFFIILAPSSSFVPIKDLAFEHRMYLSLACLAALGVAGACALLSSAELSDSRQRRLAVLGLTIVAAALWLRTSDRNRDYRFPERLWSKAAEVAPHNARAFANWAAALHRQKRDDEALAKIRQSLALHEDHGIAHTLAGSIHAALAHDEDAARHYRRAIELAPTETTAYVNYGNLLARQGKYAAAIKVYRQGLRIEPRLVDAHLNLGKAERLLGRPRPAIEAMRAAQRLNPSHLPTAQTLAWTLATSDAALPSEAEEALRLAERLVQHRAAARDPIAHDTLAAAYAQAGRFAEAATAARRAADLAEAAGDDERVQAIRERVRLYEAGLPYREEIGGGTKAEAPLGEAAAPDPS